MFNKNSHFKNIIKTLVIIALLIVPFKSANADPHIVNAVVGKDGIPFKGVDFNGKEFDLSAYYKNKPIVLNFFSVHCVSCLTTVALLEKFREKNNVKDEIAFIYISLDDWRGSKKIHVPEVWDKVFNKNQLRISDGEKLIGKMYEVGVIPVTIIIDQSGKISYRRDDYNLDFDSEINQKLGAFLKKK